MKTETLENGFESGDSWKRSVSSVDRWKGDFWKRWRKKRHMPSVPVQIGASIQDGRLSCDINICAIPVPSRFYRFQAF